jgi:hypothetical protein
MVPGSTLIYGSTLINDMESPLDSKRAPMEAAAMPFPREETTPPVIKIYLVFAIIKFIHDG